MSRGLCVCLPRQLHTGALCACVCARVFGAQSAGGPVGAFVLCWGRHDCVRPTKRWPEAGPVTGGGGERPHRGPRERCTATAGTIHGMGGWRTAGRGGWGDGKGGVELDGRNRETASGQVENGKILYIFGERKFHCQILLIHTFQNFSDDNRFMLHFSIYLKFLWHIFSSHIELNCLISLYITLTLPR